MPATGSTTPRVDKPPLPRLRLIPAGAEHAVLWHGWRNEPSTQRHNPVDPLSIEELAYRLSQVGSDCADESRTDFRWMVELDFTTLIGTVAIKDISWRMGYGELAWGIGEAYQGQGWGTQAVALLIERVFTTSRLVRQFAAIHDENWASRRIAEKNHMAYEGMLRKHFIIQGRRVNECVYSILRDEWEASK